MSNRILRRLGLLWLVLLPSVLPVRAQEDGRRLYEEQLRVELDQQQAIARQTGFDAGGWFNFNFFHFDDQSLRRDRTLRQYDLRLWASASLEGVHTLYVRSFAAYNDWNSGDNPPGDDKFLDPELERAFYRFDFNRLIRNQTGQDPKAGFTLQVGRDYYIFGTGLALAKPLDAIDLVSHFGPWQVRGLLGMTLHDDPNIDPSPAVRERQERCFEGLELRYKGLNDHEPFLYYLAQQDHTGHNQPDQHYGYDSQYLGAGSTGKLLLADLRYSTEFVFESGHSAAFASRQDEDIHAFALDALLEYLFKAPRHPKVSFEYLWGSGDGDRTGSPTAAIGGNRPGTRDTSFNGFGFRDTGLALAPSLSNLHIFELGGGLYPLEGVQPFRRLEAGTKAYFFVKDSGGAAISDVTATQSSSWIGWEWDAFINWRITSDVSWTVRYGAFFPGSAYQTQDCRQAVYTGVVYSF